LRLKNDLFGELCEQILVLQDLRVGVEGGEGEEEEGGQLRGNACSGYPLLPQYFLIYLTYQYIFSIICFFIYYL
jgi:hypothetical protein